MRLKDEDKQRRIKEAMVSLILQEGINGASVAKIASRAQVSPATIYIYYDSKEAMLGEVFRERVRPEMDGSELIDALVRGCYEYSAAHEDVFSFVEQCSRCPSLAETVCERDCSCDILDVIHEYQRRGELRRMSDWTFASLLFAPVRFLAMNRSSVCAEENALEELIETLQGLLR